MILRVVRCERFALLQRTIRIKIRKQTISPAPKLHHKIIGSISLVVSFIFAVVCSRTSLIPDVVCVNSVVVAVTVAAGLVMSLILVFFVCMESVVVAVIMGAVMVMSSILVFLVDLTSVAVAVTVAADLVIVVSVCMAVVLVPSFCRQSDGSVSLQFLL